MEDFNLNYNRNLKSNARTMRNDMTRAEVKLWDQVLKAGQMMGFTFNRQRPVGKYIADFLCKPLKLIIEVDGITHHDEDTYEKDLVREEDLKSLGFTILRVQDEEVWNDLDNVIASIEAFAEEI